MRSLWLKPSMCAFSSVSSSYRRREMSNRELEMRVCTEEIAGDRRARRRAGRSRSQDCTRKTKSKCREAKSYRMGAQLSRCLERQRCCGNTCRAAHHRQRCAPAFQHQVGPEVCRESKAEAATDPSCRLAHRSQRRQLAMKAIHNLPLRHVLLLPVQLDHYHLP